jgi:hypothetical protein
MRPLLTMKQNVDFFFYKTKSESRKAAGETDLADAAVVK